MQSAAFALIAQGAYGVRKFAERIFKPADLKTGRGGRVVLLTTARRM
jgi:hypothetical protein